MRAQQFKVIVCQKLVEWHVEVMLLREPQVLWEIAFKQIFQENLCDIVTHAQFHRKLFYKRVKIDIVIRQLDRNTGWTSGLEATVVGRKDSQRIVKHLNTFISITPEAPIESAVGKIDVLTKQVFQLTPPPTRPRNEEFLRVAEVEKRRIIRNPAPGLSDTSGERQPQTDRQLCRVIQGKPKMPRNRRAE